MRKLRIKEVRDLAEASRRPEILTQGFSIHNFPSNDFDILVTKNIMGMIK